MYVTPVLCLKRCLISSPAYGVFISQLIRYVSACFSYECFILRAMRTLYNFSDRDISCLESSLRKFYCRYEYLIKQYEVPPLPNVTCYSGARPLYRYTLYSSDSMSPICDVVTELGLIAEFGPERPRGFHRKIAAGAACQRLFPLTPDPVPFWTFMCSNVERGPGFDSRPRHLNFQRLVISCFQVEIWLKDR